MHPSCGDSTRYGDTLTDGIRRCQPWGKKGTGMQTPIGTASTRSTDGKVGDLGWGGMEAAQGQPPRTGRQGGQRELGKQSQVKNRAKVPGAAWWCALSQQEKGKKSEREEERLLQWAWWEGREREEGTHGEVGCWHGRCAVVLLQDGLQGKEEAERWGQMDGDVIRRRAVPAVGPRDGGRRWKCWSCDGGTGELAKTWSKTKASGVKIAGGREWGHCLHMAIVPGGTATLL